MNLDEKSSVDLNILFTAMGAVAAVIVFVFMNFETKAQAVIDSDRTYNEIGLLRQDLRDINKKLDWIISNEKRK